MLRTPQHRWKLYLGTTLFLVGQVVSAAHDLEFGLSQDGDHGHHGHHEHHEGVPCFSVIADEPEILLPDAPLFGVDFSGLLINSPVYRAQHAIHTRTLRPPQTGPPVPQTTQT